MALHAASLSISGAAKSGNPWARLRASYSCATRVISRITDSVKLAVRAAVLTYPLCRCVTQEAGNYVFRRPLSTFSVPEGAHGTSNRAIHPVAIRGGAASPDCYGRARRARGAGSVERSPGSRARDRLHAAAAV